MAIFKGAGVAIVTPMYDDGKVSLCCQKHQQHKSITQHGYD